MPSAEPYGYRKLQKTLTLLALACYSLNLTLGIDGCLVALLVVAALTAPVHSLALLGSLSGHCGSLERLFSGSLGEYPLASACPLSLLCGNNCPKGACCFY